MIRYITCLIVALGLSIFQIQAQSKRSSLVVRMDDGQPLTLAINGRYFHKTGTRLNVGDVPGKRPRLQVYRFRPYADGQGGKAELVFSGRIKIQRGGYYDVIVHPESRSVSVGELRPTPNEPYTERAGNLDTEPSEDQTVETLPYKEPIFTKDQAAWLQSLLSEMGGKVKDGEKLKLAISALPESLSTAEANAITEGLLFEDNKLRFIKAAYPKISDRNNLDQIKNSLSDEASKETLEQWLQHQQ